MSDTDNPSDDATKTDDEPAPSRDDQADSTDADARDAGEPDTTTPDTDELGIESRNGDIDFEAEFAALEAWNDSEGGTSEADGEDASPNRWAGISSYADAGQIDDPYEREQRMKRRERARTQREPFTWRDLFTTRDDARSTLLLAIAGGALVVAIIAIVVAIVMQQRAESFRDDANARIAELQAGVDAAAGDLSSAGERVAALVPALQNRLFTISIASMGDESGVGRIGDWDVFTPSTASEKPTMREAINRWGEPTDTKSVKGDKTLCRAVWKDIGVIATFTATSITSGTFDPVYCDYPDQIHPTQVRLTGEGWQTASGIGIGTSIDDLNESYPDATTRGNNVWLASAFDASAGSTQPLLVAQTDGEQVTALIANVD